MKNWIAIVLAVGLCALAASFPMDPPADRTQGGIETMYESSKVRESEPQPSVMEEMKEGAHRAKENIKEGAVRAKDSVKEGAHNLKENIKEGVQKILPEKSSDDKTVHEQITEQKEFVRTRRRRQNEDDVQNVKDKAGEMKDKAKEKISGEGSQGQWDQDSGSSLPIQGASRVMFEEQKKRESEKQPSFIEEIKGGWTKAKEGVSETVEDIKEKTKEVVNKGKEKTGSTIEAGGEKARETGQNIRQSAESERGEVREPRSLQRNRRQDLEQDKILGLLGKAQKLHEIGKELISEVFNAGDITSLIENRKKIEIKDTDFAAKMEEEGSSKSEDKGKEKDDKPQEKRDEPKESESSDHPEQEQKKSNDPSPQQQDRQRSGESESPKSQDQEKSNKPQSQGSHDQNRQQDQDKSKEPQSSESQDQNRQQDQDKSKEPQSSESQGQNRQQDQDKSKEPQSSESQDQNRQQDQEKSKEPQSSESQDQNRQQDQEKSKEPQSSESQDQNRQQDQDKSNKPQSSESQDQNRQQDQDKSKEPQSSESQDQNRQQDQDKSNQPQSAESQDQNRQQDQDKSNQPQSPESQDQNRQQDQDKSNQSGPQDSQGNQSQQDQDKSEEPKPPELHDPDPSAERDPVAVPQTNSDQKGDESEQERRMPEVEVLQDKENEAASEKRRRRSAEYPVPEQGNPSTSADGEPRSSKKVGDGLPSTGFGQNVLPEKLEQPGLELERRVQPGLELERRAQPGLDSERQSQTGLESDKQLEPALVFGKQLEPGSELEKQLEPQVEPGKPVEPGSELEKQLELQVEPGKQAEPGSDLEKQVAPESEQAPAALDPERQLNAGSQSAVQDDVQKARQAYEEAKRTTLRQFEESKQNLTKNAEADKKLMEAEHDLRTTRDGEKFNSEKEIARLQHELKLKQLEESVKGVKEILDHDFDEEVKEEAETYQAELKESQFYFDYNRKKGEHELDVKKQIVDSTLELELKRVEEKLKFELFKLETQLNLEQLKTMTNSSDHEKIENEFRWKISEREEELQGEMRTLQRRLEEKLEDLGRDLLHATSRLGHEFFHQFRNLKSEYRSAMYKHRSDSEKKKNEIRSNLTLRLQDLKNSYSEQIRNIQRQFKEKEEALIKECEGTQRKVCGELAQKPRAKRSAGQNGQGGSGERSDSGKKVFVTQASDPVNIRIKGDNGDLALVRILTADEMRKLRTSQSTKKRSLEQQLNSDDTKDDSSSSEESQESPDRPKEEHRQKRSPQKDVGFVVFEDCAQTPEVIISDDIENPPVILIVEKGDERQIKKRSPGPEPQYGGYGQGGTEVDIDIEQGGAPAGYGGGYDRGYGGGYGGGYGAGGMNYGGRQEYGQDYGGQGDYGDYNEGREMFKRSPHVDFDDDTEVDVVETGNPEPRQAEDETVDEADPRQKRSAEPQLIGGGGVIVDPYPYPAPVRPVVYPPIRPAGVIIDTGYLGPDPYYPEVGGVDVFLDTGAAPAATGGFVEEQVEVEMSNRKKREARNPLQPNPQGHPEFQDEVQVVIDEPNHQRKLWRTPATKPGEPTEEKMVDVQVDDDGSLKVVEQLTEFVNQRKRREAQPQTEEFEGEFIVEIVDPFRRRTRPGAPLHGRPRARPYEEEDYIEIVLDDRKKREAKPQFSRPGFEEEMEFTVYDDGPTYRRRPGFPPRIRPYEEEGYFEAEFDARYKRQANPQDEVQVDVIDEPSHYRKHSSIPGKQEDIVDVQIDDDGTRRSYEEHTVLLKAMRKREAKPQVDLAYDEAEVQVDVIDEPNHFRKHSSIPGKQEDIVDVQIDDDGTRRSYEEHSVLLKAMRKREAKPQVDPEDDETEVQVEVIASSDHHENPAEGVDVDVVVDDDDRKKRAANPQYPYGYYPEQSGVDVDIIVDDDTPYYAPGYGPYVGGGTDIDVQVDHGIYKRSPQYPQHGYEEEFQFEFYEDGPPVPPQGRPFYPGHGQAFQTRGGYPAAGFLPQGYPGAGVPFGGYPGAGGAADISIDISSGPYPFGRFKRSFVKNQPQEEEKITVVKDICPGCDKPVEGDVNTRQTDVSA